MAGREYNPRLPGIGQQVSLEPTIRSYALNSYDEKRADFIAAPDRNAGLGWEQLARSLRQWEPGLQRYTEESVREDNAITLAKYRDLQAQQERLDMSFADFTKDNPEHLGASPTAKKGWESMRLERLGMQFDTDLRQAYIDNAWVNLEKPEEYKKATSAWVAQRRQKLLGKIDEEMLPLVDKHFTTAQLRAENSLDSYHMAERLKANVAEGQQITEELTFATIDGIVRSPHTDFFSPSQQAANIANLGAYLTNIRDRSMASGVPAYMANEWIKASLFKYAEAMDLGPNDYRAEILFTALDHIPTGTGVLGRTASSQLALAEFIERSDSRRYQEEEREYRRQAREREESKRLQTEGIVFGLNDNPNASLEEICTARNLPMTADTLKAFNSYRKALSDASQVRETPENQLLTAELAVAIREGQRTINDGLEALRDGQITESQWNTIRGESPKDPAYVARMNKLTQQAGMKEAEAFLRKAWTASTEGTLGASLGGEAKVQAHLKGETAVTLFKNAVYRDIEIAEANDITVGYQEALNIVEKHKAALGDPQNSVVSDAAEARLKSQYSFAPIQKAQEVYQETTELGKRGETAYKPSPTSPISMASPRSLRILEQGAVKAGVNPLVVYAFAKHESSFKENNTPPIDPKTGKPPSSAYGYMQLVDGTAKQLGVDKYDPVQNAYGGAKYIKQIAGQHGLDLATPEDVAKAYCFYHDGPDTKGEFSETARTAGAKVAATFQALLDDSAAQQKEAAAKQATAKAEEKARIQVTFPSIRIAGEAMRMLNNNQSHPALDKLIADTLAAGGTKPTKAELEIAAANAFNALATDLSKEEKEQWLLYIAGHLSRPNLPHSKEGETETP